MAEKRRLTLQVSPELNRQLDELAEWFGSNSRSELIRRAIRKQSAHQEVYTSGSFALNADIKPNGSLEADLVAGEIIHFFGHGESSKKPSDNKPVSTLVVSALIVPEAKVADGLSIQTITVSWLEIVKHLENNWDAAHEIPPEKWEEIIAGAFKREGYDEVILTPRSGDDGRDIIAIRKGIGTVKILGSVKAYGPGRLVRHNDVRDLVGVLPIALVGDLVADANRPVHGFLRAISLVAVAARPAHTAFDELAQELRAPGVAV